MKDNNNFLFAVFLSIAIIMGWQVFYVKPHMAAVQHELDLQKAHNDATPAVAGAAPEISKPREDIIAAGFKKAERVTIDTPRLHGSINLVGGKIDDLKLASYHQTIDPKSPEIVLLSPAGSAMPQPGYYADFGWLDGSDQDKIDLPGADTVWSSDKTTLIPGGTVTLSWKNRQGLNFTRVIEVDDNYLFKITDQIENTSGKPVTLYPFGAIVRDGTPVTANSSILHEGALGVFDGTLDEAKYAKLIKDGTVEHSSTGGWLGFTDKYWLVALAPDKNENIFARFVHTMTPDAAGAADTPALQHKYQADYRGSAITINSGQSASNSVNFFAGAKEVRLLDRYTRRFGIQHFDLAIDFGWFYFLTKPFFYAIDFLATLFAGTGYGFALAILAFTVLLKLIFFPLQNRAFESMSKMKLLQPKAEELKARYKDDKMRLNQEVMELYKREKVNPLAGCLPILIQIPVFFALYKVLYVTIEMRQAPFFGWIHDLSAPDPTSVFNLFGLLHFTPPAVLMIGAWPLLMGITMFAQQKMNPPAGDPAQRRMLELMPVIFTFTLSKFPAGLVIYWAWSNSLSIVQQWVIARRVKLKTRAVNS